MKLRSCLDHYKLIELFFTLFSSEFVFKLNDINGQRTSKRLSFQQRFAIIFLYYKHRIFNEPHQVKLLRLLALHNNIFAHRNTISSILRKWKTTRIEFCISSFSKTFQYILVVNKIHFILVSVQDEKSFERSVKHTKVTLAQLLAIDRNVFFNRELSASFIKNHLNIDSSVRSVQKYIRALGEFKLFF